MNKNASSYKNVIIYPYAFVSLYVVIFSIENKNRVFEEFLALSQFKSAQHKKDEEKKPQYKMQITIDVILLDH